MDRFTASRKVRILGSAHSGIRGDFRATLFEGRRPIGADWDGVWDLSIIPVDGPTGEIRIMGIAVGRTAVFAVAGSKHEAFLATFNLELKQVAWDRLRGACDPHGLALADTHLYVVSTGNNRVIRYGLRDPSFEPDCVYAHPGGDPQHFNGIAKHNQRLILSAFGVAAASARDVEKTGYIIDAAQGACLRTRLDQPHSPTWRDGVLFFCESNASLLWVGDDTLRLDGYLRGLAISSEGFLHVARSSPRPPREMLRTDRPDAELMSLDMDGRVRGYQVLSGIGPEVFDLAMLPAG